MRRHVRADAAQVAVLLGVVEAVADDELVGDVEADVACTGMSTLTTSGLRSSVQISTEAGLRDSRLALIHDSVRPESMMSSTMSTWRPVMSVSRSLRMRTTPELFVPEP